MEALSFFCWETKRITWKGSFTCHHLPLNFKMHLHEESGKTPVMDRAHFAKSEWRPLLFYPGMCSLWQTYPWTGGLNTVFHHPSYISHLVVKIKTLWGDRKITLQLQFQMNDERFLSLFFKPSPLIICILPFRLKEMMVHCFIEQLQKKFLLLSFYATRHAI